MSRLKRGERGSSPASPDAENAKSARFCGYMRVASIRSGETAVNHCVVVALMLIERGVNAVQALPGGAYLSS
jgi:hypothetical protein